MIIRIMFQDREPYFTESILERRDDYGCYITLEADGPNGTIIGFDVKGLFNKSISPLTKTSDLSLTLQFKGREIPEIVGHEVMLIKETPIKELPLIMNDIHSWTGKKLFAEKIKG